MNFTYEATGGIQIFGCSAYKLIHFRYYQYRIGSLLFSKQKARRGIYEKIAVKDVKFPNAYVNLYVDTFNGLWTEDELVSYENAVILVEQYIDRRNAWFEEAIRICKK